MHDSDEEYPENQYCPDCKSCHDIDDMAVIDSDFVPRGTPDYLCIDCADDRADSMVDEYTSRGLSRSDFI